MNQMNQMNQMGNSGGIQYDNYAPNQSANFLQDMIGSQMQGRLAQDSQFGAMGMNMGMGMDMGANMGMGMDNTNRFGGILTPPNPM